MPKLIVIAVVWPLLAALLAPQGAAIDVGSAACKRELQADPAADARNRPRWSTAA